jgi:hypothetical protein
VREVFIPPLTIANDGAGPESGRRLLSALRSGKIDYDTAMQLAIYGCVRHQLIPKAPAFR